MGTLNHSRNIRLSAETRVTTGPGKITAGVALHLLLFGLILCGCNRSTPEVGKIQAKDIRPGSVLHLDGKNFGNDPARIDVEIGKTQAHARNVSADSIDVQVPKELEAGTYPLVVTDRKTKKSSSPVEIHVEEMIHIPTHTKLLVKINQSIGSATSSTGDTVHLVLDKPLLVQGRIAIPEGSEVVGEVTRVQSSGKVKGRAAIGFTLKEIKRGTNSMPISTDEFFRMAPSTVRRDVETIGITTGVGTLIGALAGGGKGAAIGAAVGGGAGTGAVLLTKGKEVVVPEGHVYEFSLQKPVEFQITQPLPRHAASNP